MFDAIGGNEVVIYARVSSEDQAERETIENQVEYATKYCDLNRQHIIEWYKDDGVTGTISLEQRPEGKRLIEDAKAGKVKTVLIYNLKRFSRNARITLNAVHTLEQYGVQIKSMTEPFDTTTPHGRFALTILAGVAEYDRETTLETMWHGANRAARKGKWLGGIVPYGYRLNAERFLEINDDPIPGKEDMSEASVVKFMYYLVTNQKYSTVRVADYLNALMIPPSYVRDERQVKKGKRKENTAGIWRPGRVGNMIKNPTYKGVHVYGKRTQKKDRELIEREVPAIVEADIWDQAQLVLKENQIEATRNAKRQYLLKGLIKCGYCGLNYHGTNYSKAGKKSSAYYICNGKSTYNGPILGRCQSKNIPAEWIEGLVWQECLAFINNPGDALNELAAGMEIKESQKDRLKQEKQLAIRALKDKENDKQTIMDLFRKKLISDADVERQLQTIKNENFELEVRIRKLDELLQSEEAQTRRLDSTEMLLNEMKDKLSTGETPFDVKREIVKTLVYDIVIGGGPSDGNDGSSKDASVKAQYAFSRLLSEPLSVQATTLNPIIERNSRLPLRMTNEIIQAGDTPASRIRQARNQLRMQINELALRAGLSPTAVSYIENGKNPPSLPTLRVLSQVLNQPVAFLGCFDSLPEITLGDRLRKARLYRGLEKTDTARVLGIDVRTLRDWESDKRDPSKHHEPAVHQFINERP